MCALLERFSPFANVSPDNPLFRYEMRHIKRDATPALLRRSTIRTAAIVLVPLLALWTAIVAAIIASDYSNQGVLVYRPHDSPLWPLIFVLFALSLCDKIYLDFYTMWVGLHSFKEDVTSKRWDLICLTPIQVSTIIEARGALVQARAWRVLTFAVTLRASVVLLALLTVIVPPLIYPEWRGSMTANSYTSNRSLLGLLALYPLLPAQLVLMVAYVYDPIWRYRAIATGSVCIAARMYPVSLAVFFALWKLLVIAFLQLIVMVVGGLLFASMFDTPVLITWIFGAFWALLLAFATHGIYRWRESVWYEQAYYRLELEMNLLDVKDRARAAII